MGNQNSSCCIPMHSSSKPKTAKLIDTRGNLRQVKVPVKAAELMLEDPGHAISPVEELRRTGRFKAMRADDGLSAGNVYVMVPLTRVNCKVSEAEMEFIDRASKKRRPARKGRDGKVSPAVVEDKSKEEEEDGDQTGVSGCRWGNYRQWTPVLEPISEEFEGLLS